MASTTDVAHTGRTFPRHPSTARSWARPLLIAAVAALILACVGSVLCVKYWPFTEKRVIQDLAEASDSTVRIAAFHPTYFPVPGAVVYGIEFRHGKEQRELITIQKLRITGSFSGVLRMYVPRIVAEGARVLIPPFGSKTTFHSEHSKIEIGEIVANGTLVQFMSSETDRQPLTFDVHEALLTGVQWGSPIRYRFKFHNPNPQGEIFVDGKFGAWADGHPGDTPIYGDYTFKDANLGQYEGIAGILSSQGRFQGVLQHINVAGTTDTPDFEVKSGGHKVRLRTQFQAYVDGTNGDTFLNRVDARLGRTSVIVDGSIAHTKGQKGKSAKLHLTSRDGRVEDLLGLFVTDPHSPMTGAISLEARAELPPGDESFLQKVQLAGSFGIDHGKFTHSDTQQDVDKLSAGAQGKNKDAPDDALASLKGKVALAHAIANFSELEFNVPGADAQMHGPYNLLNHRVDMHGNMQVETRISKTSSGMKAFVLKVMDPIFKKRKKGEVVPVHIAGTYEKPDFGLDLKKPPDKGSSAK